MILYDIFHRYRALYNYKPQNEDEVELCEGDIVYVMEKCDDGWFAGSVSHSMSADSVLIVCADSVSYQLILCG